MWQIYESPEVDKACKKIPKEILKRYEKWKDIVRHSGLAGLREIKGFHDEKLSGAWQRYRSSRLGEKFRVIYRAESKRFIVKVIRITPHDYRR